MTLIENILYVKNHHPGIWEALKPYEEKSDSSFAIVEARSGDLTIQIQGQYTGYVHSQYNPVREAEQFWNQQQFNSAEGAHVLFFGIGLGYHIDKFVELHPDVPFSIYEPNPFILLAFLQHRSLKKAKWKMLKKMLFGVEPQQSEEVMQYIITQSVRSHISFIALPSYQRLFAAEYEKFAEHLKNRLSDRKTGLAVNVSYGKRWTINSLLNLKTTIHTPNVFEVIHRDDFISKPALLVAAGPSLDEELENIRYIKEHGLAYIFSVGSAINTLVEYGIYPDGACTYDPSYENQFVFQKVKDRDIKEIPLIYGTSVGFETLQNYPGPLLHMQINQDTVTPYYVKYDQSEAPIVVTDAPSIAVVTLEMLSRLCCSPIVLVGQNLGYIDKRRYSSGIQYHFTSSELSDAEQKNALLVRSVDGETIQTSDSFNRMRDQMEYYIRMFTAIEFINTTKNGAHIEGTIHMPLNQVIKERLTEPVVATDWYKKGKCLPIDREYFYGKCAEMEKAIDELVSLDQSMTTAFRELVRYKDQGNQKGIQQWTTKFDRLFKQWKQNRFHEVFLQPMNRVNYELLLTQSEMIRQEPDAVKKAEMILQYHGAYIVACREELYNLYSACKHIRNIPLPDEEEN